MIHSCPYCAKELPPPTRKQSCPHCAKIIYARSRPNKPKAWIKEEDIPIILKEWADEMTRRDTEKYKQSGINSIHLTRHNIRQWVSSGVVKSLKLYTVEDNMVCPDCQTLHKKIFPIAAPEEINVIMECAHIKNCKNPLGCRCYLRPETISLDDDPLSNKPIQKKKGLFGKLFKIFK